jgi:hypothetical protein
MTLETLNSDHFIPQGGEYCSYVVINHNHFHFTDEETAAQGE